MYRNKILKIIIFVIFSLPNNSYAQNIIIGTPKIIDGDTLQIEDKKIRIWGIDAFEANQKCEEYECGKNATEAVKTIIEKSNSKIAICVQKEVDRNARIVAICRIDGIDIGANLVSSGLAVAYKKYSMEYIGEEALAKSKNIGAWPYKFQIPEEYRNGPGNELEKTNLDLKAKNLFVFSIPNIEKPNSILKNKIDNTINNAIVQRPNQKIYVDAWGNPCEIKGNINSKGEKIYHTKSSPSFSKTIAEEMFCSIEDAEDAGYRPPISNTKKKATSKIKPKKIKAAYYANCSAARAAGAAPLYYGEPGYAAKLDRDRDGVACE